MANHKFYAVEGGVLPLDASTYVERSIDRDLYKVLKSPAPYHRVCAILAPRQMGKTSLMVRTADRFTSEKAAVCVVIRLQKLGQVNSETDFWFNLLLLICQSLNDKGLVQKLDEVWNQNTKIQPSLRFCQFLKETVIPGLGSKLIIFLDEIQTLVAWELQDSFMGVLRSLVEEQESWLEQVAFVLVGVAKPSDLLSSNTITSWNVGTSLTLSGLTGNCEPLLEGLRNLVNDPTAVMGCILDWTGGQPFLTQQVCQHIRDCYLAWKQCQPKQLVEQVIEHHIITNWRQQDKLNHLHEIDNWFNRSSGDQAEKLSRVKLESLRLYRNLLNQKNIEFRGTEPQWDLLVSGLVVNKHEQLSITNRIYQSVFISTWVDKKEQQLSEYISFFLGQPVQELFFRTVKFDLKEETEKLEYEDGEALFYREPFLDLEMVAINGGTFTMGGNSKNELINEVGQEFYENWYENELPAHSVTLPDFFIGRYAITQSQYEEIMEMNPSYCKEANLPVENVSWQDAVIFCQKLSERTDKNYRLPTEAEWEYACRAGTTDSFAFGETITKKIINYNGYRSSRNRSFESRDAEQSWPGTVSVGSLPANAWGLHEMHGNVQEWCVDQWYESYSQKGETLRGDGSIAWTNKNTNMSNRFPSLRVARGGCFTSYAFDCRSAVRARWLSSLRSRTIGFRVVLSFAD